MYSRVVRYTDGKLLAISTASRRTFSDLQLPVSDLINIQMKQEEWGGEFIDVRADEQTEACLKYALGAR